ncbi:MAG: hypothetical protein ABIZ95_06325 [Pyrinomonadaceae bacterium]
MERLLLLMILVMVAAIPARSQSTMSCKESSVEVARNILINVEFGDYPRSASSFIEKANERLGDSVAPALRCIYFGSEQYKSENVRLSLPMIRTAFDFDDMVLNPEMKLPVRSLELLEEIRQNTVDKDLLEEIEWTSTYIRQNSSMAHALVCDSDCERAIGSCLSFSLSIKATSAMDPSKIMELGDAAAVGIRRRYRGDGLFDSKNINGIVRMLREAFSRPEKIADVKSRVPYMSINLLMEIGSHTNDARLRSEVDGAILFIKGRTQ